MDLTDIQKLLDKPLIKEPTSDSVALIIAPSDAADLIDAITRTTITELNAHYLMNGKYMSLSQLKEKVPEIQELANTGVIELIKKANKTLEKRGLPPYQVNISKRQGFDPDFITACHVLADVSDRRPVGSKLKEIGISTMRWNNLLKIKANRDYWNNIVNQLMDTTVWDEGRVALAKNVLEGDLPSFKYFNELTGKFVQQRDFDPRIIQVLMGTLLDIVIRHVDGNTARLIADEMDQAAISTLTGVISVPSKEIENQ